MCKFIHYVQNFSMICSVLTLTAMSIERYIAILYPLRAKLICTTKHAMMVILLVWFISLLLATPILVGQTLDPVGDRYPAYWCIPIWPAKWQHITYEMYMLVIMFIVPVTVMIVAYSGICKELYLVTSQRSKLIASSANASNERQIGHAISSASKQLKKQKKPSTEDERTKRQVVQMLVVIVLLFALCWGPILFNNVVVAFGVLPSLHYGFTKPMRVAFYLFSYMNSCLNPIVYGFMSKNFRDIFRNTFLSCVVHGPLRHGRHRLRTRDSSFATTTTRRTTSMTLSQSVSGRADFDTDQADIGSEYTLAKESSNLEEIGTV